MLGTWFYHQRVRKSVAAFGSLFNNIYVLRQNSSGEVISQIKVPLSYAPKRDFMSRIAEMNVGEEQERQIAIKLPRMSFEMLAMNYDPQRQLPKTNHRMKPLTTESGNTTRTKLYTSVPYTLQFQLNVYAKSQDDALQIVEQIIPYFSPQYSMSVKPLANFDISDDTPIILTAVSFSDDYEGPLENRRTIVYTLDFEMKVSFYGPVRTSAIIREFNTEIYNMDVGLFDSDVYLETVRVTPVPPNVSPDSDYTLDTELLRALDSA